MDDHDASTPPAPPTKVPHTALVFLCPVCECALEYAGSRAAEAGGATTDLNDYFTCPAGCGTFEHERRAHRMRLLEPTVQPAKT